MSSDLDKESMDNKVIGGIGPDYPTVMGMKAKHNLNKDNAVFLPQVDEAGNLKRIGWRKRNQKPAGQETE